MSVSGDTARKPPRLARAAGLISLATMFSRVLGLVREQLFAALFGASLFADAFNVAFRIPNLLRDLFAEGALAQAFVPTFKASLKRDGKASAYELGNRLAGTLLAIIGAIVLLAAVFAPTIVEVMAGDFAEIAGKFELTVTLTRVMLPFLAIVSMAAVAMGMLNAQDRYVAPALAPACFNIMSIVVGVALFASGASGRWVAIGWATGTLLGGLAQLGVQMPALWRSGFRPRPRLDLGLRDPGVRRVAFLMAPAVGGLAAVQINIFVNTMFASTEHGAVSWLNYAFRFLQLPIGVFGVAIATVSTTRYADAAADRDRKAMVEHLHEGLRLVLFLTVPATVGLLLLGEPIIRLIFERGLFLAHDTAATTAALDLFVVGLCAYAAVKVVAPAFYAMDMARVPVLASISAVAGNLALNIGLHPIFGYRILALGTASAAILNFAVLYVMFDRRIHSVGHVALARYLGRVGLASAVMGAAVWGSYTGFVGLVGTHGFGARSLGALGPVVVGAVVYGLACRALGVEEMAQFSKKLARRVRRGQGSANPVQAARLAGIQALAAAERSIDAAAAVRALASAGFASQASPELACEQARELAAGIRCSGAISDQSDRLDESDVGGAHIGGAVLGAVRVLEPKLERLGCRVDVDIDPSLPACAGDLNALQAVFAHLIDNAAEAASGEPITVTARLEPGGLSVVVRVVDRGPGLAPTVRGRVFEPGVSTKGPGRGVGLAVSRHLITRLGGGVALEQTPDGVCVSVFVPCAQ